MNIFNNYLDLISVMLVDYIDNTNINVKSIDYKKKIITLSNNATYLVYTDDCKNQQKIKLSFPLPFPCDHVIIVTKKTSSLSIKLLILGKSQLQKIISDDKGNRIEKKYNWLMNTVTYKFNKASFILMSDWLN
jgi:hypothetical protein